MYCTADTKHAERCRLEANEGSLFCHVHDPELQCGRQKRNGAICRIPTGGGPCQHHNGLNKPGQGKKRQRKPKATPEVRAARRAERETFIANALADIDAIFTA